jgi:hypothetical protein
MMIMMITEYSFSFIGNSLPFTELEGNIHFTITFKSKRSCYKIINLCQIPIILFVNLSKLLITSHNIVL